MERRISVKEVICGIKGVLKKYKTELKKCGKLLANFKYK